jgi:hypothetical protein
LINHFGGGHIGGVDPDHIGGVDQPHRWQY